MSNLNAKSINVGRLNVTENVMYHQGRIFDFASAAAGGQWITSGNDIYYNTGNVGIGKALDVSGNIDVCGNITTFGSLDVSGSITTSGALDVSGNIDVSSNVGIGGDIDICGNATIGGIIDASGINRITTSTWDSGTTGTYLSSLLPQNIDTVGMSGIIDISGSITMNEFKYFKMSNPNIKRSLSNPVPSNENLLTSVILLQIAGTSGPIVGNSGVQTLHAFLMEDGTQSGGAVKIGIYNNYNNFSGQNNFGPSSPFEQIRLQLHWLIINNPHS